MFLISAFFVRGVPKYVTLTLLLLGFAINGIYKEQPIIASLQGIQQNLPLLTLIILVPMLSLPLKTGGYFHSLNYFIKKWENNPRLAFFGLSSFIALISPILNMGSVKMVHEMVDKLNINPMILGKSYLIGFSSAMLWSPYFASVAIVLHEVGGEISRYIGIGLTVAIIQLAIGNLLFRNSSKKLYLPDDEKDDKEGMEAFGKEGGNTSTHLRIIVKLLGMLVALITSLLVLKYLTHLSMLMLVSLIAIIMPILWGTLTFKWKKLFDEWKNYTRSVSLMDNEITLFLSAGLFGSAITNTVFADWIQSFLMGFAEASLLLFVLVIFVVVLIFAFVGVHQIVVIPILAAQVSATGLGISPEFLALIFIISWSMTAVLCPLNAINIIVSKCLRRNGLTIGFRWNGAYIMSLVSLVIVAITVYGFL
ncbi:hypothetical protein MUO14_06565 [Halobacillus shinanisalinarum]|uniref:Uncharacterized protein n=1 Tax=Halobacillus shinanisalinarum TaxID=2932258 RepID=A0ABY4H366_9BACI|nr:hypothetical protein [Halobacillus shinanisalinarum]UOQ94608.1 hypothetical protein MUO14_06565 [Halobacillus shinanisalinarum]